MTMLSSALNPFAALSRMIEALGSEGRPAHADRQYVYALNEAYYHNQIYEPLSAGGFRQNVNAELGNAAAADLAGLYNPVAEVVDLYQHVLGGTFRRVTDDPAEDQPTDIRAESGTPALLDALDLLWGWSNLNVTKQQVCRLPALHGTCGIRIVARNDPDPTRRRVYLKPEHPRVIRDVEVDERGNVTAIDLEWELTTGLNDQQQTVTIREQMDKESIATYRQVGAALIPYNVALREDDPRAIYPNALGVVPYVLLAHQDSGGPFGLNSFYRARGPIDRLNALLTHLNQQIFDHVKVDWLVAAAGEPPARMELTGRNVIYVNTANGATPPVLEPMVAPLNIGDAIVKARLDLELIEDRLPELKAVVGRFLSGQSGETIAQLRAPAEQRLGLARAHYEDALVRASQIGVSWMVLLGLTDLGTGMGDRDAADRAYRAGLEDFTLNRRPLLPPTTQAPATARHAIAPPVAQPADAPPSQDADRDMTPEEAPAQ
jgi:hypothetical protein